MWLGGCDTGHAYAPAQRGLASPDLAGKGDAPLFHLRFRCSYCEHRGCEDPWWCRGSVRPRAEVTFELIIGIRDSSGVAGDSSASQRRIVLNCVVPTAQVRPYRLRYSKFADRNSSGIVVVSPMPTTEALLRELLHSSVARALTCPRARSGYSGNATWRAKRRRSAVCPLN